MRLDKYLSNNTQYSRSEIKTMINRKWININGKLCMNGATQVTGKETIKIKSEVVKDLGFVYYVMDKPKGYITATKDTVHNVVTELIPEEYKHLDLKPVGRLDKDTTGVLILTNDNQFIHDMTSPKKHITKVYVVDLADPIDEKYVEEFSKGISLKDGYKTLPAKLKILNDHQAEVELIEGKYHQIKRMFGAMGNKVVELRRIQFDQYKIKR